MSTFFSQDQIKVFLTAVYLELNELVVSKNCVVTLK